MFCKKCGKEIDNESSFCKFCGAALSEVEKRQVTTFYQRSQMQQLVYQQPQVQQPMYQQPQMQQPMYQQPQVQQPMYQQPQMQQPMYQQPQMQQPMYQRPQMQQPIYQQSQMQQPIYQQPQFIQPVYQPAYSVWSRYSDMALFWIIGVGISTVFAALGLFVNLLKTDLNIYEYERGFSISSFWINLGKFDDIMGIGTEGVPFIIVCVIAATVFFVLGEVAVIRMICAIVGRGDIEDIVNEGKAASLAALIGAIITAIIPILVKGVLGVELKYTFFMWVIVILSLLNILIFVPHARVAKISA